MKIVGVIPHQDSDKSDLLLENGTKICGAYISEMSVDYDRIQADTQFGHVNVVGRQQFNIKLEAEYWIEPAVKPVQVESKLMSDQEKLIEHLNKHDKRIGALLDKA